jgi:hypothetical protein
MDNSRDIPGYKYYLDAVTGERPAVYVAFVDLEPDPETAVNGVVFPVRAGGLAALDARERNYQREDVTGLLSEPPADGRVWAYLGTESARERFATGPTVVCRSYVEQMRDGFAKLGPGELARFDASTDDPPVELLELERVDLA